MRDIGAINAALVAELFDGKREHFLIDLEAEVNLPPLNVFFGQMLALVTPVKIDACAPGKPLGSLMASRLALRQMSK